jgi:hypothetical protein
MNPQEFELENEERLKEIAYIQAEKEYYEYMLLKETNRKPAKIEVNKEVIYEDKIRVDTLPF